MADFEQAGGDDRLVGGWRAIGSAWLLVLVVLALFAGFSTLSARVEAWNRPQQGLTHVIVPRHDPVCDPALPTSTEACPAAAFPFDVERAAATPET